MIRIELQQEVLLKIQYLAHHGFNKLVGYQGVETAEFPDEQSALKAVSALNTFDSFTPDAVKDQQHLNNISGNRLHSIGQKFPA
jgi:hypothetical protein